MIIVLMGGRSEERVAVIGDLTRIYKNRIQCINLAHLPSHHDRMERLQLELGRHRPTSSHIIMVVNNPDSVQEIAYFRKTGAYFAHVYGPLSSIYQQIPMQKGDVQIAPMAQAKLRPDHVLNPEQAVSEFLLRLRKGAA
ncbi:hypothetical protein [Vibrio metschnikovii]